MTCNFVKSTAVLYIQHKQRLKKTGLNMRTILNLTNDIKKQRSFIHAHLPKWLASVTRIVCDGGGSDDDDFLYFRSFEAVC